MIDDATASLLVGSLRKAMQATSVETALDEVGWRDALSAFGPAAAALLFAEQGAANAASGAIDDVLCAAMGLSPAADTAVVLPPFRRTAAAPAQGIGTVRMATAKRVVVVVADRAVTVPAADVTVRAIGGVDPSLGLASVTADALSTIGSTVVDWSAAVAAGQVALSFELIGASRTMLRLAREHALTRVQFGRPIAAFQAVRHKLAESLVAIEAANDLATAAMEIPDPQLAAMAKAVAGRNARLVARHCQQVLAGVGFTAEHDFHRYFRRVLSLDGLLGDARTLTRALGEELLRTRRIPTAPAL